MGYRLNSHNKPVFVAVSKPIMTELGIHQRLESEGKFSDTYSVWIGLSTCIITERIFL